MQRLRACVESAARRTTPTSCSSGSHLRLRSSHLVCCQRGLPWGHQGSPLLLPLFTGRVAQRAVGKPPVGVRQRWGYQSCLPKDCHSASCLRTSSLMNLRKLKKRPETATTASRSIYSTSGGTVSMAPGGQQHGRCSVSQSAPIMMLKAGIIGSMPKLITGGWTCSSYCSCYTTKCGWWRGRSLLPVPNCPGTEVSWCRNVWTLRHHIITGAEGSHDTLALLYWCRSVLVLKCLSAEVSGKRADDATSKA